MEKYVIVQTEQDYYRKQSMPTFECEKAVIAYAGNLAIGTKYKEKDFKIDRIFSFDSYGKVKFYKVVFEDGKLLLVETGEPT